MAPDGLSERGSALWESLTKDRSWDPAGLVLLAEACRIADRLEQLDLLLRRDISAWAKIVHDYQSGRKEIVLDISDALAESRQQQGSLLQILTKLGLGKASAADPKVANPIDDLIARRAARESAAKAV